MVIGHAESVVLGRAVQRQVLVELAHVERAHAADDVAAELRDVQIAEVDVLSCVLRHTLRALMLIGLRGGRRRWRPVCLNWGGNDKYGLLG